MDLSEDTKSEAKLLSELDDLHLSWDESRESTRTMGKKVMAWGRMHKIAKRTRVKMSPSPERPSKELKNSVVPSKVETGCVSRIEGFYELDLDPNRRN
jgi:hypothetical protein